MRSPSEIIFILANRSHLRRAFQQNFTPLLDTLRISRGGEADEEELLFIDSPETFVQRVSASEDCLRFNSILSSASDEEMTVKCVLSNQQGVSTMRVILEQSLTTLDLALIREIGQALKSLYIIGIEEKDSVKDGWFHVQDHILVLDLDAAIPVSDYVAFILWAEEEVTRPHSDLPLLFQKRYPDGLSEYHLPKLKKHILSWPHEYQEIFPYFTPTPFRPEAGLPLSVAQDNPHKSIILRLIDTFLAGERTEEQFWKPLMQEFNEIADLTMLQKDLDFFVGILRLSEQNKPNLKEELAAMYQDYLRR